VERTNNTLVTFNDDVNVIGDGTQPTLDIAGDKLDNYSELVCFLFLVWFCFILFHFVYFIVFYLFYFNYNSAGARKRIRFAVWA
jgi:hypothetical protein